MHGISTLPPDHLWKNASTGVDKPIADLQHGEVGLLTEHSLLRITGVRIVSVFVEPLLKHLDSGLGQVVPPLPAPIIHVHQEGVVVATTPATGVALLLLTRV